MALTDFDCSGLDLNNKSILITGGTGSFGTMLLNRLLTDYTPRRVIIFARGEYNHFVTQNSLPEEHRKRVRFFIGDVRDRDRLKMALRGVDLVIHAAAQKQVPLAEYNPFECIRTNVIGAENIVQASIEAGVKKVVALSTDKAVNPINLYGASKLASDKIFVAANALASGTGTRFSVVRYGNVLGSRGSVIPFFRDLIKDGATELPVTDERMTRFWVTLEQAVSFTLSCAHIMRGGEIFVPKIPSMRLPDLIEAMAPGIPMKHVGIRPGEKLHEIMITEHNAPNTVDYGDRYIIEPEWNFWDRDSFADEGHPAMPEGFEYSSDKNDTWLSVEELRNILKTLSPDG
ncbi:UDP-N-acetylglucosamine 4,6-dehydratase (inverting) [Kordiimonas sp. SCSIO 12603]|uniref:UDP-N-acetylglucosamine 4,6-dehydratase (inverting) n=1 Tax=Kordiimonas sp. SCSIO 12603 TaxID=2829596 RepID=UPI002107C8D5|nr:UDP-N-acetylglucosamine 4,6-dehydratase (inverting) [Kordiimonas sp. SCSIO 12603]UTW57619.1 UDP-N-acetylglucosamine 4,6-dehydratase (inverting) [Kordiimonas sp. SCSIO 12603]